MIPPAEQSATRPGRNPDCVECRWMNEPEWAADGVTPCHRIGTAAIKCPVRDPLAAAREAGT